MWFHTQELSLTCPLLNPSFEKVAHGGAFSFAFFCLLPLEGTAWVWAKLDLLSEFSFFCSIPAAVLSCHLQRFFFSWLQWLHLILNDRAAVFQAFALQHMKLCKSNKSISTAFQAWSNGAKRTVAHLSEIKIGKALRRSKSNKINSFNLLLDTLPLPHPTLTYWCPPETLPCPTPHHPDVFLSSETLPLPHPCMIREVFTNVWSAVCSDSSAWCVAYSNFPVHCTHQWNSLKLYQMEWWNFFDIHHCIIGVVCESTALFDESLLQLQLCLARESMDTHWYWYWLWRLVFNTLQCAMEYHRAINLLQLCCLREVGFMWPSH